MLCAILCLSLALLPADTGSVSAAAPRASSTTAPAPLAGADPAGLTGGEGAAVAGAAVLPERGPPADRSEAPIAPAALERPFAFARTIRWTPPAPVVLPAADPAVVRLPLTETTGPDPVVEYSDAYFTRFTIHRYASYATVPLFVAQYLAGEQLMREGSSAPAWARNSHGPLAASVAALFAVNTVTGGWNLWEGRRDPEGRTRRMLHGALMLAADAGFAATGMLAERAEESSDDRELHRTVAISSMGVSLISYAIMLPFFGND